MVFCDTMSFSGSHIEFPIKKIKKTKKIHTHFVEDDIPESFSFKMVKWFREQNLKTFFSHSVILISPLHNVMKAKINKTYCENKLENQTYG